MSRRKQTPRRVFDHKSSKGKKNGTKTRGRVPPEATVDTEERSQAEKKQGEKRQREELVRESQRPEKRIFKVEATASDDVPKDSIGYIVVQTEMAPRLQEMIQKAAIRENENEKTGTNNHLDKSRARRESEENAEFENFERAIKEVFG